MNKRGMLIVYSGPSGAGKGTLLAPLLAPKGPLVLSVSATTRCPRAGEREGVHYRFVECEQFHAMVAAGEMLEHTCYNGDFYGTPRRFVEENLERGLDVVLEIEVQGAKRVAQCCPGALMIFVMPPSFEELRRRLGQRGTESQNQLQNRLQTALVEIQHAPSYDFIIVNDDINQARKQLKQVIAAGRYLSRLQCDAIRKVSEQC
jgi:guanylate kinase